jgi:hypothetical protein
MQTRSAILWLLIWGAMIAGISGIAAFLAQDVYPNYAGPIILAGAIGPGLLLAAFLVWGRRKEFGARVRQSERAINLGSAIGTVGLVLAAVTPHSPLGAVGLIVGALGAVAVFWTVLKAVPS